MIDSEKIWNECRDNIRKLCEIKLNSYPDAADDILSETYIIFVKALRSGREIVYPKTWLYKTANNLITKKYAQLKQQRDYFLSLDVVKDETYILQIEPDFADMLITDEDIDRMADDILSTCTQEEMKILQLFHKDKKSFKEISGILGKTESAVKQQNYRLCKRIRKLVIENFNG